MYLQKKYDDYARCLYGHQTRVLHEFGKILGKVVTVVLNHRIFHQNPFNQRSCCVFGLFFQNNIKVLGGWVVGNCTFHKDIIAIKVFGALEMKDVLFSE